MDLIHCLVFQDGANREVIGGAGPALGGTGGGSGSITGNSLLEGAHKGDNGGAYGGGLGGLSDRGNSRTTKKYRWQYSNIGRKYC